MAEIERKFIVADLPAKVRRRRGVEIEQGYLAIARNSEVRIRRMGTRHVLTVKSTGTLVRNEIEIPVSRRRFDQLWPATRGARLRKRRIRLPLGNVTAEVDVYAGRLRGLVVAEVEFKTQRAANRFIPPGWFGRDVTKNARYRNQALVTAPSTRGL